MRRAAARCLAAAVLLGAEAAAGPGTGPTGIEPEAERRAVRAYYQDRFPEVAPDDFVHGVYAIDDEARATRDELEAFPPYEIAIEEGEALYAEPFADGAGYADCLGEDPARLRATYPRFDPARGGVVTLDLAINDCRERHGEAPLTWGGAAMNAMLAYLTSLARGHRIEVTVSDDPRALAAFAAGRDIFHAKRGQLNFSCADCHVTWAGHRLRDVRLAPLLGVTGHWPAYMLGSGGMGGLHARFQGCFETTRAAPYPQQSPAYRNLEYYLSYLGNGLPVAGPGIQR